MLESAAFQAKSKLPNERLKYVYDAAAFYPVLTEDDKRSPFGACAERFGCNKYFKLI